MSIHRHQPEQDEPSSRRSIAAAFVARRLRNTSVRSPCAAAAARLDANLGPFLPGPVIAIGLLVALAGCRGPATVTALITLAKCAKDANRAQLLLIRQSGGLTIPVCQDLTTRYSIFLPPCRGGTTLPPIAKLPECATEQTDCVQGCSTSGCPLETFDSGINLEPPVAGRYGLLFFALGNSDISGSTSSSVSPEGSELLGIGCTAFDVSEGDTNEVVLQLVADQCCSSASPGLL